MRTPFILKTRTEDAEKKVIVHVRTNILRKYSTKYSFLFLAKYDYKIDKNRVANDFHNADIYFRGKKYIGIL